MNSTRERRKKERKKDKQDPQLGRFQQVAVCFRQNPDSGRETGGGRSLLKRDCTISQTEEEIKTEGKKKWIKTWNFPFSSKGALVAS